jgi:anti-sigma factor ChrR (cupin superfamily)
MNCPDKEIMQDFVDGELSDTDAKPVVKHIRSCDSCKAELQEIFTLYNTLNHVVDEDQCPSLDALESYADNSCSKEQAGKIAEHIGLCGRCKSYVWALQASSEELANWQTQEELAFKEFQAGELGYDAAKETLNRLLPAKIELLDKGWQSLLSFVLDLKDKAMESWPSFGQRAQLVGVLGFDENCDPQTDAASVIMITTLYVSQLVSDGQIEPTQADIEDAVKEAAAKLGAGKELQKRLIETVPPIILKFS